MKPRNHETGGVTILVALALLGMLTVGAFGLSRGTLRELMVLGAQRQGGQAQESAESALGWSLSALEAPAQDPDPGRMALHQAVQALADGMPDLGHEVWIPAAGSMVSRLPGGEQALFQVGLTPMGRMAPPLSSVLPEGLVPGREQGLSGVMVWRIQAKSEVRVGSGMGFRGGSEAWVLDPREVGR